MNASLYISFFQGQLESALERVVQLAVREITGTVGASLSAMLLETAHREQENRRLRASVRRRGAAGAAEQHAGHSASPHGSVTEQLRLEHKRRAVGQLKLVMERVLEFGVCELSKIVEFSLDDVLLELRKAERENEELKLKLHSAPGGEENGGRHPGEEEEEEEERVLTPQVREEERGAEEVEERGAEQIQNTNDPAPSAVVSVSQDWVPVLNKVFGEAWCGDVWPLKEVSEIKTERVRLSSEGSVLDETPPPQNHHSQSEQPQWLGNTQLAANFNPEPTAPSSATGEDEHLRSPSMLQRLLTLPTQLLDGDDASMESEDSLISAVIASHMTVRDAQAAEDPVAPETEKRRPHRGGKKVHACKTCGEKFGRAHQLKTHRQVHRGAGHPGHAHSGHAHPGTAT